MSRLFVRELRRLAVPALAIFALGVVVMFFYYGLDIALWVVLVGTPWLLGATAFAPDHETGAESFLASLPVSRVKLFLLRVTSALIWSSCVVLAYCVVYELVNALVFGLGYGRLAKAMDAPEFCVVPCGTFLAAVLAAVATRRTLIAFVTAPLFGFVPAYFGSGILSSYGAPEDYYLAALVGYFPLLAAAAALTYVSVGMRREGRYGLRTACLVLAAGLTLGTGLTTVGFAFDRLLLPPGPAGVVALTKARTVAVLGVSPRGKWYRSYAPEARERVLYADSLDRPWDLPATTRALQFSPSGEWLLVFDSETHSFGLAEVAARRIDWGPLFLEGPMPPDQTGGSILAPRSVLGVRTPKSSTGTVPWAAGLSHGDRAVAWAGEVPYLHFRNSSEFTRWDGSVRRAIPEGDRIASLGGGKVLLLRGGAERVLLNLVDGAEVSLGTPASTSEACLSPSGRWLVMLDRQGAESAMLSVRDLDGSPAVRGLPLGLQAWDPAHRWTTTLDFDSLERLWLDFSPNDELALVGWTFAKAKLVPGVGRDWESRIALVNLLDGTTTTLRCDRTWAEQSQEDFDLSWVGWSASSIGFHSSEGYGSISSGEIRRLNANNPWYWHSEPVLVLGQNTILDADGSVMNLKTGSVEDHPPF